MSKGNCARSETWCYFYSCNSVIYWNEAKSSDHFNDVRKNSWTLWLVSITWISILQKERKNRGDSCLGSVSLLLGKRVWEGEGIAGGHQFWLVFSACLSVGIKVRDIPVLISSVCISIHSAKLRDSRIPLGINVQIDFFFPDWKWLIHQYLYPRRGEVWNVHSPQILCSWTLYPVGFHICS